jgi:hypothetical protein
MPTSQFFLKVRITQALETRKLGGEELNEFEMNFGSPDVYVESEILRDDGDAQTHFEVTQLEFTNIKKLRATRVIELECRFKKVKKLIALLEEDFVLNDGKWEELDAGRFMRYYFGDWEGIFIGDEMVDFESEVTLLEIA